jgi:hypothetical protein
MRPEEVLECAAHGLTPEGALLDSLERSEEAYAAIFDGQVACLFGVVHLATWNGERIGGAWLLTSDLVERHRKAFWRACRPALLELFERWDVLVNAIDVRHEKAIRWAERLGLQLGPAEPFGLAGEPFRAFRARREDVWAQPQR